MKKIFRFLVISFVVMIFVGLLIFQYLKFEYNQSFDENQFNQLKIEIKKSEPLSYDFIATYNEIHPITNLNGIIQDEFLEKYNRVCPCLILGRQLRIPSRKRIQMNYYFLVSKLEKEFSQEECLSYFASKFDFLYGNKGIRKASLFYFKKELNTLNKEELRTLIILMENPIAFDPIRNPKNLKKRLTEINN